VAPSLDVVIEAAPLSVLPSLFPSVPREEPELDTGEENIIPDAGTVSGINIGFDQAAIQPPQERSSGEKGSEATQPPLVATTTQEVVSQYAQPLSHLRWEMEAPQQQQSQPQTAVELEKQEEDPIVMAQPRSIYPTLAFAIEEPKNVVKIELNNPIELTKEVSVIEPLVLDSNAFELSEGQTESRFYKLVLHFKNSQERAEKLEKKIKGLVRECEGLEKEIWKREKKSI